MDKHLTAKGTKAFTRMLSMLRLQAWGVPATRMVLLDAFVKSIMCFGQLVWGVGVTVGS